ncbi:MAG TPA: biopolymer transporter ExbD [Acidobacteriota bacterium]|nr:biopolymer transporter ExbD [Acidobacteriota bacterium]
MQGSVEVGEVNSTINVTPLVDVCLVLLIIFMVVTPMLQKGVPVQLPITNNPDKKPDNENQLIISIKQDATIYIEQNWVPKNEFVGQLKEMRERSPGKEILIKADGRLRYKDVKKLMDMINEAGFEDVGLITEKNKDMGAS